MKKVVPVAFIIFFLLISFCSCSSSNHFPDQPYQMLNRFQLTLMNGDYETFSTQLALNDEVLSQEEFLSLQDWQSTKGTSKISQILFLFPIDGDSASLLIEYVPIPEREDGYAISKVLELSEETGSLLCEALNE